MKFLSIIPAREGSKGLKDKNIATLSNKPLIAWTIQASLKSKYISKTIVSSDSKKILDISKAFGSEVILRPSTLALDNTPSEPVIKHLLNSLDEEFDFIVLLQPTSPLRDSFDIDNSIDLLIREKASSLISVKEIDNKILKSFKIDENGYLEPISNNEYPFMPRQSLPKVYMPNGAIYIISTSEFLKHEKLISNRCISYIMSDEKSIDIDGQNDLEICEAILNKWSVYE
ncbi:acylneuraminate cytidylyltransferase family protein [Sulfurimonas lithotrophica]|uniref:Acylneuraminate cytidylyltransferase family protein n=1 Tax=Sulfurimonas lithotrophica TaxID=2590022 RepID=A0A5P8NY38_9BACT|nr:acylneuraminate cytidylyltransferase family protein [Sulfurimonas lithotrophica]QFR48341.1 acylneuraminate cytidylyltransferase family protein [Sulfurimonas lithotrophica]